MIGIVASQITISKSWVVLHSHLTNASAYTDQNQNSSFYWGTACAVGNGSVRASQLATLLNTTNAGYDANNYNNGYIIRFFIYAAAEEGTLPQTVCAYAWLQVVES